MAAWRIENCFASYQYKFKSIPGLCQNPLIIGECSSMDFVVLMISVVNFLQNFLRDKYLIGLIVYFLSSYI